MVDCEFEGVAGYVENERATRCQQENERWQEILSNKLYHNGLMTDLSFTAFKNRPSAKNWVQGKFSEKAKKIAGIFV